MFDAPPPAPPPPPPPTMLGVLLNGTNLPFIFEKVSPVSAKVATGAVQELADLDMPHYLRFTL